MEDLKKRENESRLQFIHRVYKYKQDTNNITNEQAGGICRRELQEVMDESAYRKLFQYFNSMWQEVKDEYVKDNNIIERLEVIEQREDELYKQQVKTRDKIREYRKTLRDEARIENLKDIINESVEYIANEKPFIVKDKNKNNYIKSDKVAVIQLSDWHFGTTIDNYLNTYNKDEFQNRINKLYSEVVEYCKINDVKNLKVLNQSDLISGLIHIGTRITNEEDIIAQTMFVSEVLSDLLVHWCDDFDTVDYYSVLDNHSRVVADKKQHIEKENFARIIDWYLETRLSQVKNFKIHKNTIDDNIGVVDIFNEKAFFVHGHLDSVGSVVQNLTLMTRIFPIAVFIGHLHHNIEGEVHGIDVIMNSSLSGVDRYAFDKRKTGLARQKLTIFKNDISLGKVKRLCSYFIEF